MDFQDSTSLYSSSASTQNPEQQAYMSQAPSAAYGHYQASMSASTGDHLHPSNNRPSQPLPYHHPSVFQPPGQQQQQQQQQHHHHHSGMVGAPGAPASGYSSSYSTFRPSDSYSSSMKVEDPSDSGTFDSHDNAGRQSSSSSSNSQPTSPNYPPGMNPSEHRKSLESAADIKHRRRTTKSQFQVLETTFQRDFKPTSQTRQQLAAQLGMEPRAVQIWFQNRRAKAKATAKREEAIARGEPIEFPVHGGKVSDRAPKSRAVLASLMKRAEEVKEARRRSESQQSGDAGPSRDREQDELENSDNEETSKKISRHLAAARASTGSSLISPTSSTFSDRSQQDTGYNPASASLSHLPTLTSLYDSGSTPYRFGTAQTQIPRALIGGEGVEEDERSRSSTGGNSNEFSNSSAWQSRRPSAMSTFSSTSSGSNPSFMSATSYGNPSSSMLLQQPPPGTYGRLAQGENFSHINMSGGGAMHYHSSSYPSYSSLPHLGAPGGPHPYGQPDFSAYPPAARYRSFPNVFPGTVQPAQHPSHPHQQDLNPHAPSERPYAETPHYPSNFDAEIRRVSCPDTFSAFSNSLPLQGMFMNQDHFNSSEPEEENDMIGFRKSYQQEMECQDFIQSSNLQFPPHPAYKISSCVSFSKMLKSVKSSSDKGQLNSNGSQETETGEEFLEDSEMSEEPKKPTSPEIQHKMKLGAQEGGQDDEEEDVKGHHKMSSENSLSPNTSHSVMTPKDG